MTVEVLTTSVPGSPVSFVHDGVNVTTIPNSSPGRYSFAWWMGTGLYTKVKEFDAVISVSGGATAMIHFQKGPSYTFQAHGTALGELKNALRVRSGLWPLKALRYAYWTCLDSLTYRRVDKVVAASAQVGDFLQKWPYSGAWSKTKLQVIRNAVDTSFFSFSDARRRQVRQRLGLTDQDIVAVTVSRLDLQKGVDRVLAALARSSSGAKLVVGGTGPEEQNLKGMSDERVQFLGDLDRDGVRDALAAGDVFVLPVRNFAREALPLSVLEALASGLPVIVPVESKWPADLVPLLEFVDVSNEAALSEAIARCGISPATKNRLPSGYSIEQWANEYANSQQSTVTQQ